jgi:hypothetical protein
LNVRLLDDGFLGSINSTNPGIIGIAEIELIVGGRDYPVETVSKKTGSESN